MNTTQDTPQTEITLEMICQQKAEKLSEIRASKQRMTESVSHLFKPEASEDASQALMHNFNSGIAIFNGLLTGFKIIKRIRNFFRNR